MVANVQEKFPHRGIVKLWGTQEISWFDDGGEIRFRFGTKNRRDDSKSLADMVAALCQDRKGKGVPEKIENMAVSDRYNAVELQVVNAILAYVRPHALPDKNGYYAASGGVTQSGRLFVDVNNEAHIRDPFAGRGCAETAVLRKAQKLREKENVEFRSLYLMSSIMERREGGLGFMAGIMGRSEGGLVEKYPGSVSCLCGECRQNMRSHMRAGRFVMLPSNDGTAEITINKTAKRHSDLGAGEAWEMPHRVMYPLPEYVQLEPEKLDEIRKGYAYIKDWKQEAHPIVHAFSDVVPDEKGNVTLSVAELMRLRKAYEKADMSIPALGDNPSMSNINKAMLQLIKKAYAEHHQKQPVQNLEITAVLVKTDKGEFYPSIMVNGELWLPSKPPEMPVALANAFNRVGISDVYMMTFNDHQIQREEAMVNMEAYEGHRVKMPNPAALGRLIKNLKKEKDATIHVIPVNDGTLTDEGLKELCGDKLQCQVKEAFGPDFANPKRSLAQELK